MRHIQIQLSTDYGLLNIYCFSLQAGVGKTAIAEGLAQRCVCMFYQ